MNQWFRLAVVFIVASMLVGACQSAGTQTPVVIPTVPQAALTSAAGSLKIGLVTVSGKVDDTPFNQSVWEGLKRAEGELGAVIETGAEAQAGDYAASINGLVRDGCSVIVTAGAALSNATRESAKAHADVLFIGVDQAQGEALANLAVIGFAEDQAGFLVGALAAQLSKTGKVGAVFGTDADVPTWRFGEGYRNGALHIDPKIEVELAYHNNEGADQSSLNPQRLQKSAVDMTNRKFDLIYGAGIDGSNGFLLGVNAPGTPGSDYTIQMGGGQSYAVPGAKELAAGSSFKASDATLYNLVRQVKEGSFTGGMTPGAVGYKAHPGLEPEVPAEVATKMAELSAALQDGSLKTDVAAEPPVVDICESCHW